MSAPILPQPVFDTQPGWVHLLHMARQRHGPEAAAAFQAQVDALPAHLWEDPSAFQTLRRSAMAEMARTQADSTLPLPVPSRLAALLIAHIIGIRPEPTQERVLWRLSDPSPVGVIDLPWGDHAISLLLQSDQGGGQIVQVETPVRLALELFTPHTTFTEIVPPGSTRILLTVLDRTDVREN